MRKPKEFVLHYLVMPWIDGITLDDDTWWEVGIEARTKIYSKLADQLNLLRSIPPPNPSYYGRVHYQTFRRLTDFVKYRYRTRPGPFDTYGAFLQEMYNTFEVKILKHSNKNARADLWNGGIPPIMQLMASVVLDGFTSAEAGVPKLTHLDVKLDNIMLVPPKGHPKPDLSDGLPADIGDYELFLIDWQTLSWLPAWAEAAGAMFRLPSKDNDEHLGWYEVFKRLDSCCLREAMWYVECCKHMGGLL